MKLRNYTSEKIFDPRNTHEKKIWTHEILTWKNFGLTKDPCKKILDPRNTHKGTMEHDPWNLAHSVKVYTYSESLFNTLCIEIKKNPSEKMNFTKNAPFFLSRAPTHHRFTFNSQFLCEMKRKVHLSEAVCGIFHFRFRLVFIKACIFVQLNSWTLPLLKRHNSFQK